MKGKLKRILIFAALAVFAIIALALISDESRNYDDLSNSSYSVKDDGAKALYLSVKEYGKKTNLYRTELFRKYSRFLPANSLCVVLLPEYELLLDNFEVTAIREHVKNGSTFIFIIASDDEPKFDAIVNDMSVAEVKSSESNMVYSEYAFTGKKGKIVLFPTGIDMRNGSMKNDHSTAVELLVYIGYVCRLEAYNTVLINEYFHTGNSDSAGSDIYGMGVTLCIVQLIITIIIWMIYKGVRLGKPETVYKTIKRSETENIYALANLYKKANSPMIAFEVHMEVLLSDLAVYLGYGSIDESNREEIYAEIYADKRLKVMGVGRLLKLYEDPDGIRKINLRILIEKIDKIRREI